MEDRTLGWIQDTGDINHLKVIAKVFDKDNEFTVNLINVTIPYLIPERFGRDKFIEEIKNIDKGILFKSLIGKGAGCQLTVEEREAYFSESKEIAQKAVLKKGRPNAACSGILQAAIKGTGKNRLYQTEWSVTCALRLAIATGIVSYDNETDLCKITDFGKSFSKTTDGSDEEKEMLSSMFLSYPPLIRVLELLSNNEKMTKFELGNLLGFVGEDGFTSINQKLFVSEFFNLPVNERGKFKSDYEGSSDKYARTISSWLVKLGWAQKSTKTVFGYSEREKTLLECYNITVLGRRMYKKALLRNNKLLIHSPMLSPKSSDKFFLRKRRAILLLELKNERTINELQEILLKNNIDIPQSVIKDELKGFERIGVKINQKGNKYYLNNSIIGLTVPKKNTQSSDLTEIKNRVTDKLVHVDHKYLTLIDYAFNGKLNKEYEILTSELFIEELEFDGCHLGGSNRPDNIIYYDTDGIIIDNKAYAKGYNLHAKQRDEMIRYIQDNKVRDEKINSTKWWEAFADKVNHFNFLFLSSKFSGKFDDGLINISRRTGYDGGVMTSESLLYLAEMLKSGKLEYSNVKSLFNNNEIIIS